MHFHPPPPSLFTSTGVARAKLDSDIEPEKEMEFLLYTLNLQRDLTLSRSNGVLLDKIQA